MSAFLPDEDWTEGAEQYSHWAGKYIVKAIENHVIDVDYIEEDDQANEEITRADVVRILGKCDLIIADSYQGFAEMEFYDVEDLDDEAYAMLAHCVSQGYITGYDDATFKPDKTLTRAEVATILYRYLNK